MAECGMDKASIIRSSTYLAAEAAGKEKEVGLIREGYLADMIVLNEDPLQNLNALENIEMVIKSGKSIRPEQLIATTPETLAQEQLNAYNARDIEAFLEPYAEDVRIFNFPDTQTPTTEGKEAMRAGYASMFERATDLHCELVNRIVQGNTVIDQEKVIFSKDQPELEAIAIYKIVDNKIAEVYFVR